MAFKRLWFASCFVAAISLSQAVPLVAQSTHILPHLSLSPITDGRKGDSLFAIESHGQTVARGQVRAGDQPVMVAVRLKIEGLDDEVILRLEKDARFVRNVLQLGQLRGEIRADADKLQELSQKIGELERAGRSDEARALTAQGRSMVQVIGDFELIRRTLASSQRAASALDAIREVSHEQRPRNVTEFALQKLAHVMSAQYAHEPAVKSFRPVANRIQTRFASAYQYVQTRDCYYELNYCNFWFFVMTGACIDMGYWCRVEEWFGPDSWFNCSELWESCVMFAFYDFGWCLCDECPENYNCPWPG